MQASLPLSEQVPAVTTTLVRDTSVSAFSFCFFLDPLGEGHQLGPNGLHVLPHCCMADVCNWVKQAVLDGCHFSCSLQGLSRFPPSSFSPVTAFHGCTRGGLAPSCEAGGTDCSLGKQPGPGGLSAGILKSHWLARTVEVKAARVPQNHGHAPPGVKLGVLCSWELHSCQFLGRVLRAAGKGMSKS